MYLTLDRCTAGVVLSAQYIYQLGVTCEAKMGRFSFALSFFSAQIRHFEKLHVGNVNLPADKNRASHPM